MPQSHIDYTDKEILKTLLEDARIPYLDIAKKLKVSNSLVHQRIKKMKEKGIISGSVISLDPKQLGYLSCAYTGIVLKEAKYCEEVAKKLEEVPEVVECHYVSGKYALFVKLFAFDNDHMRIVLYEKLHQIDGVTGTDTFMSFKTYFDREVGIM